ncbi:type I restriction endonuclease subunit R [Cyanothece sp. BG0011]|uniref:type I restriction endonuclease subunit R n=1 Tax=Cyanothece sp. BG0011 TaxID=2082950 RepID=UPI000D1FD2E9|nr:type I restriction endonuclease [Cyanothece sp. BG0011]
MPSETNEKSLENSIETALINAGYQQGNPKDFNREFAIDTAKLWQFLETTQPEELAKLKDHHNWERLILERLNRKILKDGIISVLKKGIYLDNAHLTLLNSLPYNDLNPQITADFQKNIFSITRQVYYSRNNRKSIDIVLFINGIPITTLELKNPWTNQTVYHAKQQYKNDRDPQEPLFNFGRCLVHFAVDIDEVYMTTHLDGKNTYFLPFNKGNNHGKGNPVNPNGYKTAYLWTDILTPESLTNIIEHFAILVTKKDKKTKKIAKNLYFPRYHQLDVVRQLIQNTKDNGIGKTYLIQHSAGSGKSNSITWTAYQLIEVYQPGADTPLFDSVIVVTDRRNLDTQIKDNIKQFSEVKNIITHAENSQQLKTALENGKKIIISTIQKFPFVVDSIEQLKNHNFAVIIDEAHSSQSGKAADSLNTVVNKDGDEAPEDFQDKILKAMEGRKLSKNASYFAFTATPKNTTLEKFGQRNIDEKYQPFHLYSMKQAIEEGFILDVLEKYTTYRSYYEIQKSIDDNPVFNTNQAQKKLRKYVESHKQTIATKAEIMVNHFIEKVYKTKIMKGKAKAMVITRNIEAAIRYFQAIKTLLKEYNAPFQAVAAFSGKKTVDGIEYSEDILNNFPSKDIEEKFNSDDYKILIVANKFLTGFDQPLLHTMYVDKKLQGVLAVQALSRLNRCHAKLGKNDTFILDFFNSINEIKTAFDPFYTATSLREPTNINILHDLKENLDDVGVYEQSEVKEFNQLFFNNSDADQLSPIIDLAADRFNQTLNLEEEEKIDFKIKAKQFVKIYGQMACIIPFNNSHWEMLYWFLKFLIPKLTVRNPEQDTLDELLESVDLSTYGIERVHLNPVKIDLNDDESEIEPQNPNPRGYYPSEAKQDPLDEIINAFNERYFSGWDATPEEQRVKLQTIINHVCNNPQYESQVINNPDEQNRNIALQEIIQQAVNAQRRTNLDLYKLYASNSEFRQTFNQIIITFLLNNQEVS